MSKCDEYEKSESRKGKEVVQQSKAYEKELSIIMPYC